MKKSEDTAELITDICTLIHEVRTACPGKGSGRREGVHCPSALSKESRHVCKTTTQCGEQVKLQETVGNLNLNGPLLLSLDAVGCGVELREGKVGPGNSELLLERWTIAIGNSCEDSGATGAGHCNGKMLVQAVHSHLHFSQISAWLSSSQGRLPAFLKFRLSDYSDFRLHPDTHKFPVLHLPDRRSLTVTVHSLPRCPLRPPTECREERLPALASTPVKSPTSCSQQANLQAIGSGTACVSYSSDEVCVVSSNLHDSGIYSPGPVDRFYSWSTPSTFPRFNRPPSPRASPKARKRKALRHSLLGSFEESILRNRFTPAGHIPGFKFKMSASGLFSSPSVTLPFTAQFYNFSEAPSPYTACVGLDSCGVHGYQIPRQGRIQATVLDPNNSAIRIFLVPFDVRDMPPRSHTFHRQRIYCVNECGKRSLLYHMHLRFISGRSTRVYLHSDIRLLFTRGAGSSVDLGVSSDPGNVVEDVVPHNPRYSTINRTKKPTT